MKIPPQDFSMHYFQNRMVAPNLDRTFRVETEHHIPIIIRIRFLVKRPSKTRSQAALKDLRFG
jgi:hypothetical protein